jgi:hypothetical protein
MKAAIPLDSTPHGGLQLPFANEMEVQKFVEKYAEEDFGLKVVASTTPGKRGLFKIDVLAVDDDNNPFIIECKWDRVDRGAIQQLVSYKKSLLDNWTSFVERVSEARGMQIALKSREPVLIAIGYRFAPSVLTAANSVVCLAYAYHDVNLSGDVVKPCRSGKVSIHHAHQIPMPKCGHPSVCKKSSTIKAVARLPTQLQKAFWQIDGRLCELDAVTVVRYKNVVNYWVPRGLFANAKIGSECIQWHYVERGVWKDKEMFAARDTKKIFQRLCQAHVEAG